MEQKQWAPNVILVDADYLDNVAFNLIVNFERMLGRRIKQADLCHWLDCIALDSGLRPGDNEIQVVFLHGKQTTRLKNFSPSNFEEDLNGLSFKDNLGRFNLFAFPVEEVVEKDEFVVQSVAMTADEKQVKRLMIVADMDACGDRIKRICAQTDSKEKVLFAMEPLTGCGFNQEILGYSLMAALGIRGEELQ